MLQSGSVADNFDPMATEPAAGKGWLLDGPHIMLTFPTDKVLQPFSTEHGWGGPYIMMSGSPMSHIMVPAVAQAVPADDPLHNALSAAPLGIAEQATIMDWPSTAGGDLVQLRAGANGWTCLTDDPTTPRNDPVCLNDNALEFLKAKLAGRDPKYTGVGIGYRLQGGNSASITDPALAKPADGQSWLVDGPYLFVVSPWTLDPAFYSTDPKSGGPYIKFGGTPYQQLVIPLQ